MRIKYCFNQISQYFSPRFATWKIIAEVLPSTVQFLFRFGFHRLDKIAGGSVVWDRFITSVLCYSVISGYRPFTGWKPNQLIYRPAKLKATGGDVTQGRSRAFIRRLVSGRRSCGVMTTHSWLPFMRQRVHDLFRGFRFISGRSSSSVVPRCVCDVYQFERVLPAYIKIK